ncbi:MAG: twin-arginine translocation signal domain-containing protein [Halodesulfurarchaeum sp.]
MTRRTFIGAVGGSALAAIAGCAGGREPATVQVSLAEVDSPDPLTDGETQELDPGSYYGDGFEIAEQTTIEYTVEVLEGSNVSVFVLDEENLDDFEAEESFEAVPDSIDLDVESVEEVGLDLDPAIYYLVVYNGDDTLDNA